MRSVTRVLAITILGTSALACRRDDNKSLPMPTRASASPAGASAPAAASSAAQAFVSNGAKLAATSMATLIYEKPDLSSGRLGYLRLGAIVERAAAPAGNERCAKGWYAVKPRGYVCLSRGATLDTDEPLVRAAKRRPETSLPLPYTYVFVRAVAPQYLRVPTEDEQDKTEFKLRPHLGYWGRHWREIHRVVPGANDAALEEQARISGAGDSGAVAPGKRSTELSVGELLGGDSDNDPPPFWLAGGRSIPNVAAFQAAPNKFYSERVRRHTGLAVVGSWQAGPEALNRRFSVTVDLRLIPADKLKPDTASAFHGVELGPALNLPLGFVRDACDPKKQLPCTHLYRFDGDEVHQLEATVGYRTPVGLSGKKRSVGPEVFHETLEGRWLRARDIGLAEAPTEWPLGAKAGKKWVEVSILNETLVLWEGQKPVYATLVSAGQDGLKDPKTTKSTVLGAFRIFNKQITATMDSNERAAPPGGSSEARAGASDNTTKVAPRSERFDPGTSQAKRPSPGPDADDDDAEHPESPFELRDVPYVQYFESGYALHAAYWHDAFGTARSHGCVNLSPIDARRVFFWTDPPVPEGWHGVSAGTGEGTMVVVHK
jgi:hypothetical protein